jgi:phosphoglycerate dehydrogenase-like enzyme
VVYTSRTQKHLPDLPNARRVSLEELLQTSDFVSLHTDLSAETRGLINRQRLALMKPTSVLVNTSRGGVIDQEALVEALVAGRPMAAGLDVTDPEPLSPDHPLVGLANCIILPHIGSATIASRDAMANICVDNLLAGLSGNPLRCPVV